MARVKDVILDDGWKLKAVPAALTLTAIVLGSFITWNALSHTKRAQSASAGNVPSAITAPAASDVVLKYDPVIQETQREMLALGVYKGPVDGVNGPRTQQSIAAYQQLNGLAQTGVATPELINHMKFTHKVQAAAQFTGSVAPTTAEAVAAPKPQTTVIYEKAAAEAASAAKAKEEAIKRVQVALAGQGYKIKKIDGKVNPETRAAILKFEMDNGMDMTGVVDKTLTSALKAE